MPGKVSFPALIMNRHGTEGNMSRCGRRWHDLDNQMPPAEYKSPYYQRGTDEWRFRGGIYPPRTKGLRYPDTARFNISNGGL